jgi:hypothetical protein
LPIKIHAKLVCLNLPVKNGRATIYLSYLSTDKHDMINMIDPRMRINRNQLHPGNLNEMVSIKNGDHIVMVSIASGHHPVDYSNPLFK